jgi:hypothetical protein
MAAKSSASGFKLTVFHTVPADEHNFVFAKFVDSALDDFAQHGQIHAFCADPKPLQLPFMMTS